MIDDIVERRIDGKEYEIPQEIRDIAQWVAWRAERKTDGKINKIPIDPKTGGNAKSNNPDTWGSFNVALKCYQEKKLAGIGYVFTQDDPYTGVDLDDCFNGQLDGWAENIIKRLDSYTEVSPSGKGAKIFLKGKLPAGKKVFKDNGIDAAFYDSGRFFAVTGHVFGLSSRNIEDRQDELLKLHKELSAGNGLVTPENHQVAVIHNEFVDIDSLPIPNGTKSLIRHGEEKGLRSESIMSVINSLVANKIPDTVISQIFEQYPIGEKYLEKGAAKTNWLQNHIIKARDFTTTSETKKMVPLEPVDFPLLTIGIDWGALMEQKPKIIEPFFAESGHILIVGESGSGKSLLRTHLSLCLASGQPWLGFNVPKRRRVLIAQWENTDTLEQARLAQMGQAMGISSLDGHIVYHPQKFRFDLRRHGDRDKLIELVRQAVETHGVDVIVYDCLGNLYTGNENDNNERRAALDTISYVNALFGTSAILIHHMNQPHKDQKQINPMYRARGGTSLIDWAEAIINFENAPSVSGDEIRRLVFTKTRYCAKPKMITVRRDKNLVYHITQDPKKCPPAKVNEILSNMGGRCGSRTALQNEIIKCTGLKSRAVAESISEAEQEGYIKKGQRAGKEVPYHVV
jgi:RecA-family ATPase